MAEGRDLTGIEGALKRLEADREALPWPERRSLAQSLADTLASEAVSPSALALLFLLADDPKWEVRRDVADCLLLIPEDEFPRLVAKLSGDSNAFVRKAAERALDRRRRGQRSDEQHRQGLGDIESQFEALEKLHGKVAAEKARRLAERLYDLMAGAAVHDMRGIITPLKSSAIGLLARFDDGSLDPKLFRKELFKMKDRVAILERLLDDMRGFSQPTPPERRRERLLDVVSESHGVVKDMFAATGRDVSGVSVFIGVPESIAIEVTRQSIVAAVVNVLKNAYDAFATGPETFGKGKIELRARAVEGNMVEIVVADDGMGLSKEELAKVREFIPGGTSKKQHGTGFGLPTARRRIIDHGGDLGIDSEEAKGTTVTITLPVDAERRA